MDETEIRTLEDVDRFLSGTGAARPFLHGGKDDTYAWIERALVRLGYLWVDRKGKGIIRRYLMQLSGYSRQQITRLISQYRKNGRIRRRQRTVKGFERKYTPDDIQLLATVDRLVDDVSGTTTKAYCQRAYDVYGDQRFVRLADISVSHIYNLRGSKTYRRIRQTFTKTKGAKVSIGQRCKPRPNGEPGYLRVDSVHQGDRDGKKGVYHINSVDEITQWEIVVTVAQINEQFMIPALKSLLEQFPFVIKGFHADNGSEYINRHVAKLLNTMMIQLSKSRPRHSNDNALAESKNSSVVRKTFGYVHIPQKHAALIEEFNTVTLNPCLNFHRPCHFPTIEIDSKGKEKKRYHQKDMMTPYEKLKSLPEAERYLKGDITMAMLEQVAMKQSDLNAWEQMQKARNRLFDIIFNRPTQVA